MIRNDDRSGVVVVITQQDLNSGELARKDLIDAILDSGAGVMALPHGLDPEMTATVTRRIAQDAVDYMRHGYRVFLLRSDRTERSAYDHFETELERWNERCEHLPDASIEAAQHAIAAAAQGTS